MSVQTPVINAPAPAHPRRSISRSPRAARRNRGAFTLIELLVVLGVVAVLTALLFPSLRVAREKAQRVACANRLRLLAAAAIQYGTENHGHLPRGDLDTTDGLEHCFFVSRDTYNVFLKFQGRPLPDQAPGKNGTGDPAVACPNLYGNDSNPLPFDRDIGWQLGYNYLGDHRLLEKHNYWPVPSPVRLTDRGSLPLFSDLNDWSTTENWTIVPHQRYGGGGFFTGKSGGSEPIVYGAAGGNVALLDGSVRWRVVGRVTPDPSDAHVARAGETLLYYTAGYPGIGEFEAHKGLW